MTLNCVVVFCWLVLVGLANCREDKKKPEVMSKPMTEEEWIEIRKEFEKKKDCTGYKPPKRIQCDISLYLDKKITDTEAQNDIQIALNEWRKENGDLEQIAFMSLNLKTWGLGVGYAESMVTKWIYELPLQIPRWHRREYVSHFIEGSKPKIIYAVSEHEGNDVIDHWSSWTTLEGSDTGNLLYVQNSRNSKDLGEDCQNFLDLPKNLKDRKRVSCFKKCKDVFNYS